MSIYEEWLAGLAELLRERLPLIAVEELHYDEEITDLDYPELPTVLTAVE